MPLSRRALLLSAAGTLAASASRAQDAPASRTLRLIVPLPPGGPTDFLARTVAQGLSASLGQPVVVDNRPGADGAIAAREVMAAAPDGHTLLFASGSMVSQPLQTRPPAYEWSEQFAPLGMVARVGFCLAVHPDVPARTVAELVEHARRHAGGLNFPSSTPSELLAATQFMRATGTQLARVPYKGGAQGLPDLLAGRLQVMFGPTFLALPHARGGALRVLATLEPQRSPLLPQVPTLAEAGVAGVDVPTWQAVFAPARTPQPVRSRLAAAVAEAMAAPQLRAELEQRGLSLDVAAPQALAATVARDQLAWRALLAEHKLGE